MYKKQRFKDAGIFNEVSDLEITKQEDKINIKYKNETNKNSLPY